MNRKGAALITVLIVLVALVLCLTTLFNFISSNNGYQSISNHISGAVYELKFNEDYADKTLKEMASLAINAADKNDFYNSFLIWFKRIAGNKYLIEGTGNLREKIAGGNFEVKDNTDGSYSLNVKGVLIEAGSEVKMSRKEDLAVRFDKNGVLNG